MIRLCKKCALLAQLDRAFGYGPKGRGFESYTARQKEVTRMCDFLFYVIKDSKMNSKNTSDKKSQTVFTF